MADPIISISSDTSKESVGLSTSRVVLFGTIPTIIPADVSTLEPASIPSVIHDSAAEIPIILPRAPKAKVTVVALPAGVLDLITYSSTDSDSLEDPSAPEHAPSAPATSPFLHSSDSFKTSRDSAVSGSLERPPPLDSHEATVAWSSHSVTTHSPASSTGPSRKRRRSPTTLVTSATSTPRALVHVRDVLLPPCKRIRGSLTALSPEDTIEESLEVDSEEDIDSDVMADIEADIAAKAAAADEIRAETKVGFKELYDHMEEIPAWRVADIEEEQRAREIRALADEREMTRMRERISVLEGSNMRLSQGSFG
ncbi:hypothetical protein Tco_1047358 [Tanacetum coccineum]